jgi:serine/threonine protein kinase
MGAADKEAPVRLLRRVSAPDFDDIPTLASRVRRPVPVDESIEIRIDSFDELDDDFEDREPVTPIDGSEAVTLRVPPVAGRRTQPAKPGLSEPTQEMPFLQIEPGEIVPGTRYRVVSFLGDGGMGVVYEAEHVDLERRVALKVLHRDLSRKPGAIKMFRDEARAASKVGAEQIVQLFDFAALPDGRVMFTMELLQGPTLFEALEQGPMAPARAVGVLRQVCKGLSAAHRAGVIHRDVKPENVVLETRRGRPDAVKILDFGIATVVGEATERPLAAGTPLYLAPELVSASTSDHRVDVYAFGCMAYEMLTGRPPFDAPDGEVATVLRKHVEEPVVSPSVLLARIPEALSRVVLRCLEKNPDRRPSSMDDVELALCEAQIEARLVTPWDDLPVPDGGDPALRARILEALPQLRARPPRARWLWPLVAGASLVLGAASLALTLRRTEPAVAPVVIPPAPVINVETTAAPSPVDVLVTEVRTAAAKSFFVVPPVEAPRTPTAYTRLLELEAMSGNVAEEARVRALALREELAATLVRLGDAYWEREAGKPFAVDYYRQALVFDRAHARALERADVTPDEIAAFERKAATLDFTDDEIDAAEPLVVLAEPDKATRRQKLERLGARRTAEGGDASTGESDDARRSLLQLAEADVPLPLMRRAATSSKADRIGRVEPEIPHEPIPLEEPVEEPVEELLEERVVEEATPGSDPEGTDVPVEPAPDDILEPDTGG